MDESSVWDEASSYGEHFLDVAADVVSVTASGTAAYYGGIEVGIEANYNDISTGNVPVTVSPAVGYGFSGRFTVDAEVFSVCSFNSETDYSVTNTLCLGIGLGVCGSATLLGDDSVASVTLSFGFVLGASDVVSVNNSLGPLTYEYDLLEPLNETGEVK